MRNLLLVARREYLERVRTRSFILSTLGLPVLMAVIILLPQKLATMKAHGARRIVVAVASQELGAAVQRNLTAGTAKLGVTYSVEVDANTTDNERKRLTERVTAGEIDGYLWMPAEAVSARKVTYSGRELSDFMDVESVKRAVTNAFMEEQLAARGISPDITRDLLQEVKLDTLRITGGKETSTSTTAGFLTSFVLVMMLYTTLALYGVSVMRAVIEEKTSRVLEVLLSSLSSRDLMMGKVLGVGAVGLTQVLMWSVMAGVYLVPAAAASAALKGANLSPLVIGAFAVFFLLGYLLYSALYAAIGATVNSEQESQQLQLIGMSPLIIAISCMMLVLRQPNSPVAVVMSLIPFFAPVLMYMRIAIQTPPLWQIGVCLALLIATVVGTMALCGRIYRVGILMYGKRPTLPEILKWIRYA